MSIHARESEAAKKEPELTKEQQEAEKLREKVAELENKVKAQAAHLATGALPEEIKDEVKARKGAGLTHEQAVEVTLKQRAHDATNPHDEPPDKGKSKAAKPHESKP